MKAAFASSLCALLAACASSSVTFEERREKSLAIAPEEPLRVAIMPFKNSASSSGFLSALATPFVLVARILALDFSDSAPSSDQGAQMLRYLLAARLQSAPLAIVNLSSIDASLAASGLDIDTVEKRDSTEICGWLDVDLVICGELLEWGPTYYLLETRRTVDAVVRVRGIREKKELYRARAAVSDGSGISGGPTGYASLLAVPLAALDGGPYSELAIEWGDRVGSAMTKQLEQFDEPEGATKKHAIEAATIHEPLESYGAGDFVTVRARAPRGERLIFDLGDYRTEVPMIEVDQLDDEWSLYEGSYGFIAVPRELELEVAVSMHGDDGPAITQRLATPIRLVPARR